MIEFSLFFKAFRLGKHYIRCTSLLFWWVFFATVPVFSQSKTALPPAMVFVPGGSLVLGCTPEQEECMRDECPPREITVGDFYMAIFEVTQAQWSSVIGLGNPSIFQNCGETCPVEQISWYQAAAFCNLLSQMHGYEPCYYRNAGLTIVHGKDFQGNLYNTGNVYWKKTANGFRFPTEAEWEYAARGGTAAIAQTRYSGSDVPGQVAWYSANSQAGYPAPPLVGGVGTQEVGLKAPNALGIHDMSGNVWEFCFDVYNSDCSNPSSETCNPSGPNVVVGNRIVRGGGITSSTEFIRVANRSDTGVGVPPDAATQRIIGIRLVRNP